MSSTYQSNKSSSSSMYKNGSNGYVSRITPPYSNGSNRVTTTPSCKVCIDAGKTDFNHYVKNLDGSTNCPTLLSQDCRYCKTIGHTAKYCPILAKHKKEDAAIMRQQPTTTQSKVTKPTVCFTSKNVFATLVDSDEDEDIVNKTQPPPIKTNNFSIIVKATEVKATATDTKKNQGFKNPLISSSSYQSEVPNKISYAAIASAAAQASAKADLDYQQCGDFIYNFIIEKRSQFAEYAPRITGMLMEQLTLSEIHQVVKNEKELDERITEGIQVMIMPTPTPTKPELVKVQIKEPIKQVQFSNKVIRISGHKRNWCDDSSDDEDDDDKCIF